MTDRGSTSNSDRHISICPKCSADVPENGALHCPYCGSRLESPPPTSRRSHILRFIAAIVLYPVLVFAVLPIAAFIAYAGTDPTQQSLRSLAFVFLLGWTAGAVARRVGYRRRDGYLMLVPVLGEVQVVRWLWRLTSPTEYWSTGEPQGFRWSAIWGVVISVVFAAALVVASVQQSSRPPQSTSTGFRLGRFHSRPFPVPTRFTFFTPEPVLPATSTFVLPPEPTSTPCVTKDITVTALSFSPSQYSGDWDLSAVVTNTTGVEINLDSLTVGVALSNNPSHFDDSEVLSPPNPSFGISPGQNVKVSGTYFPTADGVKPVRLRWVPAENTVSWSPADSSVSRCP